MGKSSFTSFSYLKNVWQTFVHTRGVRCAIIKGIAPAEGHAAELYVVVSPC
jgi:hypothetical protein